MFFSRDQILIATSAASGIAGHQWLYLLALVTSALTAFYITRLLILVFWGQPRAVPNFRSRIDDPGRMLLVPFAALAMMAMAAGLLTPPQLWGDYLIPGETSDSLGNFLASVMVAPEPHELGRDEQWQVIRWGGVASLIGAVAAWFLYRYRLEFTHTLSDKLAAPARWVRSGFAFDDLYRWSFVRPTVAVSAAVAERGVEHLLFERLIIGGSARVARAIAEFGRRWVQSGVVSLYFATFALGAVGMAIYFVLGGGLSSPGPGPGMDGAN
jgi:NADH-quinone oxidoreductase subunit L